MAGANPTIKSDKKHVFKKSTYQHVFQRNFSFPSEIICQDTP